MSKGVEGAEADDADEGARVKCVILLLLLVMFSNDVVKRGCVDRTSSKWTGLYRLCVCKRYNLDAYGDTNVKEDGMSVVMAYSLILIRVHSY